MKTSDYLKAKEIHEEIDSLKKGLEFFKDKEYKGVAHFSFVQHYGNLHNWQIVNISRKHNDFFKEYLEKTISDLYKQLDEL